jgi:probable dihydroxyacetone kinase regulator
MAASTKRALAASLRKLLENKTLDKITVRDITDDCQVNRQTFYYHFEDVYDLLEYVFESDADKYLPKVIVYDRWKEDVVYYFKYLYDNRDFAISLFHSNSRDYLLKYYHDKLKFCVESFAKIVSGDMIIEKGDFDFVVELYTNAVVGIISQWLGGGMAIPDWFTTDRCMEVMNNSVEQLLMRFDRSER